MIGTIQPSWKELKCNGLQKDVANSMCRTCAALGNKGITARPLLSFDAIFLSLFSQDEEFVNSRIRYRPFSVAIGCSVRPTGVGRRTSNAERTGTQSMCALSTKL
jgi:hypothetical protein